MRARAFFRWTDGREKWVSPAHKTAKLRLRGLSSRRALTLSQHERQLVLKNSRDLAPEMVHKHLS